MKLSAVIPTRGDVDLLPLIQHLRQYPEVDDIHVVVSDTPYSRYVAAAGCRHEVILTQDDDCLTDLTPLIEHWRWLRLPVERMVINAMTPEHAAQYSGSQTLIGFGALFHRDALRVLDGWHEWAEREGWLALFLRESDRVFPSLLPHVTVFPKIEILPYAYAENRYWRQPEHLKTKAAIEEKIREWSRRQESNPQPYPYEVVGQFGLGARIEPV